MYLLFKELGNELDISLVMSRWTEQMGYPVIDITINGNQVTATPTRFLSNPTEDPTQPPAPYE